MGGNHTETKRLFDRYDSNEVLGDRDELLVKFCTLLQKCF